MSTFEFGHPVVVDQGSAEDAVKGVIVAGPFPPVADGADTYDVKLDTTGLVFPWPEDKITSQHEIEAKRLILP